MTTSYTNQAETQRGTPAWLNTIIVLLVLLVGVWAVYYFGFRKSASSQADVEEVIDGGSGRRMWSPPASRPYVASTDRRWPAGGQAGAGQGNRGQGGGRGNITAPNRDEIIRRTNSGANIRARHNDVLLSAAYAQAKGVHDVDLNYSFDLMEKWVSAKEIQLHMLAWRASNITNTATAIGLTADQRKKLLALQYHMTVTPAELANVRQLVAAWVAAENSAASREKASAAVLAAMTQLGKLHEPATKSLFQARIAAIPTILTPDQITKLRELQNAANSTPTPAPAVRAAVPTTKPTAP